MAVGATEILTALQQIVQALNKQTMVMTPSATREVVFQQPLVPRSPDGYIDMINPANNKPVKVPFYND